MNQDIIYVIEDIVDQLSTLNVNRDTEAFNSFFKEYIRISNLKGLNKEDVSNLMYLLFMALHESSYSLTAIVYDGDIHHKGKPPFPINGNIFRLAWETLGKYNYMPDLVNRVFKVNKLWEAYKLLKSI